MAQKIFTQHQFKAVIEQDEDGYFVASIPALPGCYTQSKNITELKKRMQDAIRLCLSVAKNNAKYRARIW